MSISAALSNALSGLNLNSRAASIVSDNIANAMTEGYGVRSLEYASRRSGGVQVNAMSRAVDIRLLHDRRLTDAEFGAAEAGAGALDRLLRAVGTPDDASSLTGLVAELGSRLTLAASDPSSTLRLTQVANGAGALANKVRFVADAIQRERMQAESAIASGVDRLNANLAAVHRLNVAITHARNTNGESAALEDQRQLLIDEIAELVPVREFERPHGVLALMTEDGQMLLDGPPKQFAFTPANEITAHMTLGAGTLSGLTLDGEPISAAPGGKLTGGRLAALFDIRDNRMVSAQANLDGFARDLVERFQDAAVDPTLGSGDAGLFTDGGAAFDPADEVGLSARLALNGSIDPAAGGDVSLLRDGLNAASPGAAGDATILTALRDALATPRSVVSGLLSGQSGDASLGATSFVSAIAGSSEIADRSLVFASARQVEMRSLEMSKGVDTDAEMQRLLVIEKMYAANARVIDVIDAMFDSIMRI